MCATPTKKTPIAIDSAQERAESNWVLRFLRDTSSYPDRPTQVKVVETHISWVFVTDEYAYKLKKPVRFEFLDFSTTEKRRRACLDELRLNRRLAPNIYLAVLPITRSAAGELALNGVGAPIDWVVHMRRLRDSRSVTALIQSGELTAKDGDAIVQLLADFYSGLPGVHVSPDEYRATIERHIRANAETLLTAPQQEMPRIRRSINAQLRYLHVQSDLLAKRVGEGRIVDGHGDLRPEHIYLNRHPVVIDCVEFSEELRRVDIADDLSFLAMECEHLGAADLGNCIMAACERICGDVVPAHLSAFYRSYRACVRAKVALLRMHQQAGERRGISQFEQYLRLADRHAAELGPPMLLVVSGLMGSGKSTLATELAHCMGAAYISTDECRRNQFGPSDTPASYGEALYRPEMRRNIYDEVFHRAEEVLRGRESAILDGTFLTALLRQQAYDLAFRYRAAALLVRCTCPESAAMARLQRRLAIGGGASEARAELYDTQSREYEPPGAEEPMVVVNTLRPFDDQVNTVCKALRLRLFRDGT